MDNRKIKGIIESILFAAGREVKIGELMSSLELGSEDIINAVESLKLDYDKEIDYNKVNKKLDEERKKSIDWLNNAINS